MGAVRSITEVSVPIFFLNDFSANILPIIWLLPTLALPLIGLVLSRVKNHAIPLTIFILFQLTFWLLFTSVESKWVSLSYAVFTSIQDTLIAYIVMDIELAYLDSREIRRFGGLFNIALITSSLIVGVSVGLFIGKVGVNVFPLLNGLNVFVALITYKQIKKRLKPIGVEEEVTKKGKEKEEKFRFTPYIANLSLSIFLLLTVSLVVKNIFYDIGHQHFSITGFAKFLGYYNAAFSVFSLVFSAFLYRTMMLRFTLPVVLLTPTLIISLLVVALLATSIFDSSSTSIFWLITIIQLLFTGMKVSIINQASLIFLQVFSPAKKSNVAKNIETFIKPLSMAIASSFLLLFNLYIGLSVVYLSVFVLVLYFLHLLSILSLYKIYLPISRSFLSRGRMSSTSFSLDDIVVQQELRKKLNSDESDEIIKAISLLSEVMGSRELMNAYLPTLVKHEDESVRCAIYEYLCKYPNAEMFESLKENLSTESGETVSLLLRALTGYKNDEVVPILKKYSLEGIESIKLSAIASLVRYDHRNQTSHAESALSIDKESTKKEKIVFLQVLNKAKLPIYEDKLTILLMDSDKEVRFFAIQLAGSLGYRDLWPEVIKNLSIPPYINQAFSALEAGGSRARAHLINELRNISSQESIRELIMLLLAKIPNAEYISLLSILYPTIRLFARTKILRSLSIEREQLEDYYPIIRSHILEQEILFAGRLKSIIASFFDTKGFEPLIRAFGEEIKESEKRILFILTILYKDFLSKDFVEIFMQRKEMRAGALELLDNILIPSEKQVILAIFENNQEKKLSPILSKYVRDLKVISHIDALKNFFKEEENWNNIWIKACALYCCLQNHLVEKIPEIEELSNSSWPILKTFSRKALQFYDKDWSSIEELESFELTFKLKKSKIFQNVSEANIFRLVDSYQKVVINDGVYLFREGEYANAIYYILEGSLGVLRDNRVVNKLEVGEVFAELAFFLEGKRTASVFANETTKLIEISSENFYKLIDSETDVLFGVIKVLCERIKQKYSQGHEANMTSTIKLNFDSEKMRNQQRDSKNRILSLLDRIFVLKSCHIFKEFNKETLASLAEGASEVILLKGESLIVEGEIGTTMYVVCEGNLAVYQNKKLIGRVDEGDIVGEMALLTLDERFASVIAKEYSVLLELNQTLLKSLFDLHPKSLKNFIQFLIQRLLEE